MDLVGILQGNNEDKLSPALSSTDKGQTPELDSTDQVLLHPVSGDSSGLKSAQDAANELQTSDGLVTNIEGDSSAYKGIDFPTSKERSSAGKLGHDITSSLKQKAKEIKYLIGDEIEALSGILDYSARMGIQGFIGETKNLFRSAINTKFGKRGTDRNRFSNGVAALIMDGDTPDDTEVNKKQLWNDDIVIEGKVSHKKVAILPNKPIQYDADLLDNTTEGRKQNLMKGIVDNSLRGEWKNYQKNLAGTTKSIYDAAYEHIENRVQSVASKILGSSIKFGSKKKKTQWISFKSGKGANWRCTAYNSIANNSGYKVAEFSQSSHFKGYADLQNFDARVDRYYDFSIEAPEDLRQLGLPPAVSQECYKVKTNWDRLSIDSPTINIDKNVKLREKKPLDLQSNINSVDTVRLSNGDTYDLGQFGSVALTKRLDMVASITTTMIEDNEYSVRTWLENYKKYMYSIDNNDISRINPYIHRPIYQGFYYIKFFSYDPSRNKELYSRIFWGVPNFDLNITPNPSDVKMFQINWDIIGESEIKTNNEAGRDSIKYDEAK